MNTMNIIETRLNEAYNSMRENFSLRIDSGEVTVADCVDYHHFAQHFALDLAAALDEAFSKIVTSSDSPFTANAAPTVKEKQDFLVAAHKRVRFLKSHVNALSHHLKRCQALEERLVNEVGYPDGFGE